MARSIGDRGPEGPPLHSDRGLKARRYALCDSVRERSWTARHITSFATSSAVREAAGDRMAGAKPWGVYWHSVLVGGGC